MNVVQVKNVRFNEGKPKVCVPVVAKSKKEILDEFKYAISLDCDVIEWRIDHYEDVLETEELSLLAKELHALSEEKVFLITFRSYREGGVLDISDEEYALIYQELIKEQACDMLDIELFMPDKLVSELVDLAHDHGLTVIMCNHDFHQTVSHEEIVRRLCMMQDKGADICKIAMMPQSEEDVLTLLAASLDMAKNHARCPLITMSMGSMGTISRISGEIFGSSMTFGVGRSSSAPGQIPVDRLQKCLEIIHLSK